MSCFGGHPLVQKGSLYIDKVLISVCLFGCPIITLEPWTDLPQNF